MAETVKRLRVHRLLASQPCAHCGDELILGEAGAVCEACEYPHHERCWDEKNGCGQDNCQNAYLPSIGPTEPVINLRADEKLCRYCRKKIYLHAEKCRHCGEIVSYDGQYHGEKKLAPAANLSLLLSVFGLLVCVTPLTSLIALLLGPLAFKNGLDAKKLIATDPMIRGQGMATAGQILGVLDIMICIVALIALPPGAMNLLINQAAYYIVPVMGILLVVILLRRARSRG